MYLPVLYFVFCHTNPYIYLYVEGINNLTR